MKVVTKQIELNKTVDLSSSYIENSLAEMGIVPLRWAIVAVSAEKYILSVAYEESNC